MRVAREGGIMHGGCWVGRFNTNLARASPALIWLRLSVILDQLRAQSWSNARAGVCIRHACL